MNKRTNKAILGVGYKKVADMEVDMVADINMDTDIDIDININMEIQFGWSRGLVNWIKTF